MIPSVSPEAERELTDGAVYYAREANADLGLAFIAEFERALGLLCTHPELGVPWRRDRRRFPLRRFPYSIIYYIRGEVVLSHLPITGVGLTTGLPASEVHLGAWESQGPTSACSRPAYRPRYHSVRGVARHWWCSSFGTPLPGGRLKLGVSYHEAQASPPTMKMQSRGSRLPSSDIFISAQVMALLGTQEDPTRIKRVARLKAVKASW